MEQLRDWRKAKGISTTEAGALIEVSGVQWSRMENGSRSVAADKVLDVERVTGVSRHHLRPDIFGPAPSSERAA
ncbi:MULTISPECIES: helix-turn-helix domain-containing protein [unclassified Mesorhizobium]|uniref:helix-turn-helix domain-containing protein n=1 Tax=unclassified Mesorhizobium TaxID=325217 RepID=UPI000BAEE4EA|nr:MULTISPECIES: helix-turn-helix transcriptional regulator [unclassified Mesorhizobium]PBC23502.1 transcriptional regulator [Mesorhizobium sp. WSM4311]TRD06868.1 helix-turn-helix domain-containing protein [Mesorhizobium sp. WSM4305]